MNPTPPRTTSTPSVTTTSGWSPNAAMLPGSMEKPALQKAITEKNHARYHEWTSRTASANCCPLVNCPHSANVPSASIRSMATTTHTTSDRNPRTPETPYAFMRENSL